MKNRGCLNVTLLPEEENIMRKKAEFKEFSKERNKVAFFKRLQITNVFILVLNGSIGKEVLLSTTVYFNLF